MLGSRKFQINSYSESCALLVFTLSFLFIYGCSGSGETERNENKETTLKEFLSKYEKTFDPSDYDENVNIIKEEEKRRQIIEEVELNYSTAIPETIPGFRVQILLTQDIEHAQQTKENITTLLIEEWVYIVYDSPNYKVRVGDFTDRSSANQLGKKLIDAGYKNSWIVPDRVLKNPPPKPVVPQEGPELQEQR